ncbi:MAG TPA: hypothetical protein VMA75_04980 [Candidatus Paceibacterota bacterium]|nr:hypothetical protein [Candidatus Paceibacterota bacterium]
MTIKIKKKNSKGYRYKSSKHIVTSRDIKAADKFDARLEKEIRDIENLLVKRKMLTASARKHDMLAAWYLIGTHINEFLKTNVVSPEEEKLFWDHLYGRSSLVGENVPSAKISKTRNDFRIASLIASYRLPELKKVGNWALWREILTYKAVKDTRVLDWIAKEIQQIKPKTRNEARPLLKAVAERLRKIDTGVLSEKELTGKLNEIRRDTT